jgi:hypothetical protein
VKTSGSSCLCLRVNEFKEVFTAGGKFSVVRHVEKSIEAQQRSLFTQYLSESKHIPIVVSLKGPTGRQFFIGESSATNYSSGLSLFGSFTTGLFKAFVSADISLFKRKNHEVTNFVSKVHSDKYS